MQDEKLTDGKKHLQVVEGEVSNETFPGSRCVLVKVHLTPIFFFLQRIHLLFEAPGRQKNFNLVESSIFSALSK